MVVETSKDARSECARGTTLGGVVFRDSVFTRRDALMSVLGLTGIAGGMGAFVGVCQYDNTLTAQEREYLAKLADMRVTWNEHRADGGDFCRWTCEVEDGHAVHLQRSIKRDGRELFWVAAEGPTRQFSFKGCNIKSRREDLAAIRNLIASVEEDSRH